MRVKRGSLRLGIGEVAAEVAGASGKNPRGSMGTIFSGRRGLKAFTLGCGHVH